jgi:hypothetical protein
MAARVPHWLFFSSILALSLDVKASRNSPAGKVYPYAQLTIKSTGLFRRETAANWKKT